MGSGYRGNFGPTKGSKIIASNKSEKVITARPVISATGKEKTIIEKAPLKIPKSAVYEVQKKPTYTQIKIKYKKGEYEYESRWHTPTPKSPKGIGNTYQITREIKGKGYGKDSSKKVLDHMIRYPSGKVKWVNDDTYQNALRNHKKGRATKKEEEIVIYGHIK